MEYVPAEIDGMIGIAGCVIAGIIILVIAVVTLTEKLR